MREPEVDLGDLVGGARQVRVLLVPHRDIEGYHICGTIHDESRRGEVLESRPLAGLQGKDLWGIVPRGECIIDSGGLAIRVRNDDSDVVIAGVVINPEPEGGVADLIGVVKTCPDKFGIS